MRVDTRARLRFWSLLATTVGLFVVGVSVFLLGVIYLVVLFSDESARGDWPFAAGMTVVGLLLLAALPLCAAAAQSAVDPSRRAGRCRRCGYDLRPASSTRCPECGETLGRD